MKNARNFFGSIIFFPGNQHVMKQCSKERDKEKFTCELFFMDSSLSFRLWAIVRKKNSDKTDSSKASKVHLR